MLRTAGAVVAAGIAVIAVIGLPRGDGRAPPRIVVGSHPPGPIAPAAMPARVLSERDPFSPPPALRPANPSAPSSLQEQSPGRIAPEPTGTGAVPTPPAPTAPPTSPSAAPPGCGVARPSECRRVGAHVIELVRVVGRHPRPFVDLELDGDPVTHVREGDRFADGFKLVGFNDSLCPRIVVGDEAFTLCERRRRS